VPRPPTIIRARDLGPRTFRRGFGRGLMAATIVLAEGACRASAPSTGSAAPVESRPLARLATQAVALVPTQYVRSGDSTGWSARIGPVPAFLRSLDSAIAGELAARGTARTWVTAEALGRTARRNPAFTSDPYALSAESLRHGVRRTNARLGEPLASQMRSLVALTDARYALVPVELRFEPSAGATTRAVLRLVLVDARLAELQWVGDVSVEDASPTVPDLLAAFADRVADLLVAP